jgi:hypothetical protein
MYLKPLLTAEDAEVAEIAQSKTENQGANQGRHE